MVTQASENDARPLKGLAVVHCCDLSALTPKRNEIVQSCFAKIQTSPDHQSDIDWEELVSQQRTADAHMCGYRPTQVSGEEDRTEDRRARHQIQRQTNELDQANQAHGVGRIAELRRSLNGRCEHEHF